MDEHIMEDYTATRIRDGHRALMGNRRLLAIRSDILRRSSRPTNTVGDWGSGIHRYTLLPLLLLQARRARPSNGLLHLRRTALDHLRKHLGMGNRQAGQNRPHRCLALALPR